MSKLKVIDVDKMADVRSLSGQFYRKSEADKVIAELETDYKEACDRLQTANLIKDEQLAATRHHKHKRCVAMAKWCRKHDEFIQLESERLGLPQSTLFLEYRRKAMWWNKWRKRWLELAEKFKEAK